MQNLKATATAAVTNSPAVWLVTALGAAVALAVSFGHLSTAESAALYSAVAAAGTIVTAALTRPVSVSVLSGAAVIILGDLALFGFPALSSDQKAALAGALTFALGAFLHLAGVSTVSMARKAAAGKTGA